MSDNDIPNSRYFEWQEDPWGEGHLRAAEGLDLSATQRGEDEFERVEVKGKWYLSGAFQPAPSCYIGDQYNSFLCDGRYLLNCVPGGQRVFMEFWGGFFQAGAYILFFLGMLTNIFVALVTGENFLPWQDNLPEDLIYIYVFLITFFIVFLSLGKWILAAANKKQYFWFIFDRETGLLHSPGTVPGKKGAPGLNIKFNKLSALMQSAINFVYGGSSQQNMLAAPYYPKGQKPPRHHSFKFFNISLHFPTHDGICGMPALITTLNQFMDKSKPYPDSLKKMIQNFQDRGTYVNGEPLQEKDKIKEKLYDIENERVIHPNGIAYQYINECLDKGEEPRDSQLMYRIREYRNKYPIDTLQAKAQAEKEVEALEGKLSLKEQRKKETFARIERLKAMIGDSEEHDK